MREKFINMKILKNWGVRFYMAIFTPWAYKTERERKEKEPKHEQRKLPKVSQGAKPLTESQKRKLERTITISTTRKIGQYISTLSDRGSCASYAYIYALGVQAGKKQSKRKRRKAKAPKRQKKQRKGQKAKARTAEEKRQQKKTPTQ